MAIRAALGILRGPILVGAVVAGQIFLLSACSQEGASRSWEHTQALVKDIEAHHARCGDPSSEDAAQAQKCANEKADLIARQQKLGATNQAINDRLDADKAGWRWP